MSIRKKLFLSHTAIILIPSFLFIIGLMLVFFVFVGKDGMMNLSKLEEQTSQENEIFSKLRLLTTSNPDKLIDVEYLTEIDREAHSLGLSFVMRINDKITYQSPQLSQTSIEKALAPFGSFKSYTHNSITVDGDSFKYDQHDFYLPNKQEGSMFLIKETSPLENFLVKFHPWLLLLLLIVLILTNGLISYYLSKNLINPLLTLKGATQKIKEGELNFKIETDRKDEIGELFQSFEEMRSKLKQSIELQLKYEENRKLLLSNISHDLKTPITSIKGYVEGIQDGIADNPEKMERYIKTIYKKANDMDIMIDELFLFSKLDLRKIPFEFQVIDIISYIRECVEDMSFEYEKEGMTIRFNHNHHSRLNAIADAEKLMRVFTNIIGNSVKYKETDSGVVNISVQPSEDWVEVIIKDDGPGISKGDLPFIFDQFFRADPSRNHQKGGSGIGLAIARHIIEEHGGKIWVESEVNNGTAIHFTLKREKDR